MSIISKGKIVLAAGLLSCVATAANAATVMNFNSLRAADPTDYTYVTGGYKEGGYTLNASLCQGSNNTGCFIGVQNFKSMDKAGAAIAAQVGYPNAITLTRDNGAAFLFQSIDFSEYFDNLIYNPFSISLNFNFVFADGSTGSATRTFSTTGAYLPYTLTFDMAAVRSVSFTPLDFVQFDNIVLGDVAAAVPEPATWGMMILGFGMIGSAARRRAKVKSVRFA